MLLMDYPSIRGEGLPDCAHTSKWEIFYSYIDAHSQILIDEYPVDEV